MRRAPAKPRPDRDPLYTVETYQTESSVGFLLGRCVSRLAELVDAALAEHGITSQQFGVLHAIHTGRATSPSELARVHLRYSAAITYVLDGLEGKQLLARRRSAEDRRVVELALTPQGEQVTRQCIPLMVQAHNRFLDVLDRDEYEVVMGLLGRLADGP